MSEKSFLYQRIYQDLLGRIVSGDLSAGSRLPTEMQLKDEYGVSRITSKKALNMLAENGYAVRRPGLGTFVLGADAKDRPAAPPLPIRHKPLQQKTMGLVMERIDESYGLTLFYEIDRQAEALGYRLIFLLSYGNQQRESSALRFLSEEGAGGLMIMPTHGRHYNTDLLRLVLDGYPVVLVDRRLHGIPASAVYTDNVQGCFDLTEHLVQKGHRRIGFVMLPAGEALSLDDRLTGYQKALSQHGIPPEDQWVLQAGLSTNPSHENPEGAASDIAQVKAYLQRNPHLTAIIASEYNIAPMIRRAAADLGLRIPQDLALCCFDDHYDYTGYHHYTHVKQNEPAMAEAAVRKLAGMMENPQEHTKTRDQLIPAVFHQGQTT